MDDSWSFQGFEKMTDNSNHWLLTPVDNKKIKQVQWCATEKVHGANFCWIVSPHGIQSGNRNQLLGPSEAFFGWQSVLVNVESSLKNLFTILTNSERAKTIFGEKSPVLRAFIFGEIFGGVYPDMPSPAGVRAVQTGIYYSPNVEFAAFDLAVTFESEPSVRTYVDFEVALKLFAEVGIFHVQPLMVGTYTQAVNYNNRFESGIAKSLGFPSVANNLAEGIVIRPMRTILVPTKKGLERPILKSKIAEFAEDKRFQGATKWDDSRASSSSYSDISMSPETIVADLTYEGTSLVTTQRIDNAISKMGHVDPSDRARMRQLLNNYMKDIIDQIQENYSEQWNSLPPNCTQEIETAIKSEAVALFRTHFKISPAPSSSQN